MAAATVPVRLFSSCLPFLLTFLFVFVVVLRRLVPLILSGQPLGQPQSPLQGHGRGWDRENDWEREKLSWRGDGLRSSRNSISSKPPIKRLSAFTFSATIALAAVLGELILCEISNTIDPIARGLAFNTTISLLLVLLVLVIPFLEIRSVISAGGYEFSGPGQGRLRLAWVFQLIGFTAWLLVFWRSGERLRSRHMTHPAPGHPDRLTEACLERVGVMGISLMSLLSGFAAVSAPWQHLFSRPRPVTETDIARQQAGLEATADMLAVKRARLQALERKMSDQNPPRESFFHQALGSIRGIGNADLTERKALDVEISGLETMFASLSASLAIRQSRFREQTRARTPTGRLLLVFSSIFSIFCLYRIVSTSLTAIRRLLLPRDPSSSSSSSSSSSTSAAPQSFTPSDPVNHILALVAQHYDPQLDRAAWARQLSFLLSGIILAASVSSAMQTFRLLARFAPRLLRAAQANLALVVAQVCATYVISAALVLGGLMPGQVVGDGLRALGGREMGWVEVWFERWFLAGAGVTAGGIWLGRKFSGGGGAVGGGEGDWGEWGDDDWRGEGEGGMLEGGKRS